MRFRKSALRIGIIGAGSCDTATAEIARETGRLLAERGALLYCGGLSGVMEAACQGAVSAGGTTIGIIPGNTPQDANPYVTIPVATGLGQARNLVIINSSDALIAISGRYGTLSEIAFALKLGKPVIGLSTWREIPGVIETSSPEEAVNLAIKEALQQRWK